MDPFLTAAKDCLKIRDCGNIASREEIDEEGIIREYWMPANVTVQDEEVVVQCLRKNEIDKGNAIYIGNLKDRIAIGAAARNSNIKYMISDNFSGCEFNLWRSDSDELIGAHIYYGGECKELEANMNKFAEAKGWKKMYYCGFSGELDIAKTEQGWVVVTIEEDKIEFAAFAYTDMKCTRVIKYVTLERKKDNV